MTRALPRALVAIALPALVLATGCPSYTQIPDAARAEIDAARQGQLLWLKQSLYVGQFYDDDRYALVYPRRFEELSYLRTVEGDVISPPPASGIIPAGTRVRVERIDWPTGEAVFRRPIYTPRYATWVMLRVARDRGDTYLEREQRHILLLPGGIPDESQFDQWFSAYFSVDDPNPWLQSLSREVRDGVFAKRPVVGMDYDTLTAAMGYPDRMTREGGASSTTEVVIFGPVSVVLENGVVTRVSDPLAEDPSARPAPLPSASEVVGEVPSSDAPVDAPAPATMDPPPTDEPSSDAAPADPTEDPSGVGPAPADAPVDDAAPPGDTAPAEPTVDAPTADTPPP